MTDLGFEFDENAEEYFEYYILENGPIRVTVFNQAPVLAEIINTETKMLKIDNTFIVRLAKSTSAYEIDENEFNEKCLSLGIQPKRLK